VGRIARVIAEVYPRLTTQLGLEDLLARRILPGRAGRLIDSAPSGK
jgi:hypothetical protein